MSIGSNIKKYRLEHGMSQLELAEAIGTGMSTVSMWENDSRIPRMGAIQKIADLFNIQKSTLIEETKPLPQQKQLSDQGRRLMAYFQKLSPESAKQLLDFAEFLSAKEKAPSEDGANS